MAFETTREEILKQAIELKKLYDSTRIQSYKDQELRLRRIVVELDNLTLGVSDLNSLTDVTISSPTNGQVLTYNSTTSQWENQAGGGSGYVPYTGATGDVNLGTHRLLAARGTFSNNGSTDTLTVDHTSGSGYGIIVTKGGANEALYVNKTSGSGNAMTVVGGRTSLVDLALSSVSNAAGDFLTLSGGVVHRRTAAQVLSDISVPTPTLAQVTTAGNTTTNAITVGSLNLGSSVAISTLSAFGLNYFSVTALTAGQGIAASFVPSGTPTSFAYNFQFNKSSTTNNNALLFIGGGSAATANSANKHVISTSAEGTALGQPLVLRVAGSSQSWVSVNDHFTIFPTGNVVIQNASSSATDAGFRLDVNGTTRATSFVRSGGTALQYLLADGSVKTTTAATDFVQYGDFVSYPTFSGKTVTMHPSTVKTLLWGGLNARYTVTDTFTGTYPNAGSTWIRTIELIDGTNSVYPAGNVYLGFWVNFPPLNITVRTQNTSGTFFGPFTGSDIRVGGGGFAYWKIPVGGGNFIKKWEITLTPQPGLSINLQTLDIVIDNNEGIDQDPFVNRSGSSMYGSLSFRNATTANVTLNTNGVVSLLFLRPSNTGQVIEFQNTGGTKAGSMFMDGTIWRFKSHNSSDTLNIFANGNLGIRQTTDAGYAFDVNGTSRLNGAVTATLANVSTANVVYYNSSTGLMTYGTAPIGAQFKIDYDPNITGTRNGVNLLFTTSSTFIATTTRVFLNGQRLTRGATYDYVETGTNQITFAVAPVSTDQLIIEYQI
jgi:hypothetical protein